MAGKLFAAGVAIFDLDDVSSFSVASGSYGNRVQYRFKSDPQQAHDLMTTRSHETALVIVRKLGLAKNQHSNIDILETVASSYEDAA